jgi:hypothetical protein
MVQVKYVGVDRPPSAAKSRWFGHSKESTVAADRFVASVFARDWTSGEDLHGVRHILAASLATPTGIVVLSGAATDESFLHVEFRFRA